MAVFIMESKPGGQEYNKRQVTLGLDDTSDVADLPNHTDYALGSAAMVLSNSDTYLLGSNGWVKL
jgi:hypothetical protein